MINGYTRNENIWLTQRMMAELYDVTVPDINQHLKKIYADGELSADSTIKKYLIVQTEGSRNVSSVFLKLCPRRGHNYCRGHITVLL